MKAPFVPLLFAVLAFAQSSPNVANTRYCTNTPTGAPLLPPRGAGNGDLRKITLNAPGAVCNDGTPAIMYVRAARAGATEPDGPSANRWLIHFEGGGSCLTFEDCLIRWCGAGFYTARQMSTTYENDAVSRGGLLNRNGLNRLADRNTVFLNYCSSDGWAGRKSGAILRNPADPNQTFSVDFQGATIADAAFTALERGVTGMPRLTEATDVLISGDSGGANGVRVHLDRLAARLRAANPVVRVRGQMEATFFPDFNGKQGFPAGDPRDPVYARKTQTYNDNDVALLNAIQDDSCAAAHPNARYLCGDGSFTELNHITTPFFQMQDLTDSQMLEALEEGGLQASPAEIAAGLHDQITALGNIRATAVERAAITQNPAVVARNCGVHVMWGDDDGFFGKKVRATPESPAYSYYDLLWNWMTGVAPATLLTRKPPLSPAVPTADPDCSARASTAPAPAALSTASSATYSFTTPVAPESIVVSFGSNLATGTSVASTAAWPTSLGGVQVSVVDSRGVSRLAPLYFVSPGQIAYLIPAGTATGPAQIVAGTQRSSVEVSATAPGIYTANQRGTGVASASYVRVAANGRRTDGLLFDPASAADTGVPAAAGDQIFLILYGTGMRGGSATATVGGVSVPVAGPVAQGQYLGLDQINLGPLPTRIGLGQKQIVIRQGDQLSNTVTVTFRNP